MTPATVNSVTQQDIIKKFMNSLDTTKSSGAKALSEAVNVATNGYFKTIYAAINRMYNDCFNCKSENKNFLKEKCGIDLTNDDNTFGKPLKLGGQREQ